LASSVVLLHGGGTSARQWDLVVERLAAPALALDVPGRGDRPVPAAPPIATAEPIERCDDRYKLFGRKSSHV
jgi:pimeloyl-ACP methyl ester carboxylesterase